MSLADICVLYICWFYACTQVNINKISRFGAPFLTLTMKDGSVMIHLDISLVEEASMLPHWLNPNHFLSSFLRQASWFCPVWSKLEAITSGSGEITSLHYMLWLIFHNTASSFKVLTETLNTKGPCH